MLLTSQLKEFATLFEQIVSTEALSDSRLKTELSKFSRYNIVYAPLTPEDKLEFLQHIQDKLILDEKHPNYHNTVLFMNAFFERDNTNDAFLKAMNQFISLSKKQDMTRITSYSNLQNFLTALIKHPAPEDLVAAYQTLHSMEQLKPYLDIIDFRKAINNVSAPHIRANALKKVLDKYSTVHFKLDDFISILKHPAPQEIGGALDMILALTLDSPNILSSHYYIESLLLHPSPKILAESLSQLIQNGVFLNVKSLKALSNPNNDTRERLAELTQAIFDFKKYKHHHSIPFNMQDIIQHKHPIDLVKAIQYLTEHYDVLPYSTMNYPLIKALIESETPLETAAAYQTLMFDLELGPSVITALHHPKCDDIINVLTILKQHRLLNTITISELLSLDNEKIEVVRQAIQLLQDNLINRDNINIIMNHPRPQFLLSVFQSIVKTNHTITQADLDKIHADPYHNWRSDNPPKMEATNAEVSLSDLDLWQSETFKQAVRQKAFGEYRKSMVMMEHAVRDVALQYIKIPGHSTATVFQEGKREQRPSGPLLDFATIYSNRYLDLYKAYVYIQNKKGVPLIPVSAGQMKLHGFLDEEILQMQPAAEKLTDLLTFLRHDLGIDEKTVYENVAKILVGMDKEGKYEKLHQFSTKEMGDFLGSPLRVEQHQTMINYLNAYNKEATKEPRDLLNRAYFLMHDFGHLSYPGISEQLDYVGRITPEHLVQHPSDDKRLIMEISHRVGGDSSIHQNSPGTLGSNPLAYLKVLEKGDPNPDAEFRNKMYFVYMSNHFANAVIRDDEMMR